MLILEIDKRVKGDLETIWKILTDMKSFSETAPDIIRVEQVSGDALGMVRRIHHKSGRSWEEECKEWETQSRFSMEVKTDSYPLPVTYLRRITSMEQRQKNVVIKIRYEYTPKYGPLGYFLNKHQIRPILKIFSTQLLDNLAKKIHQQNTDTSITAATILKNKDPAILTITPDTLISEASKILTDKRIGCVIALNPQGIIAGILSERDIVNGLANAGQPILNMAATQFMTHDVIVSHPEDSMAKLMSIMSAKRIRHLPVIDDNNHLVGVISIGDIINARMIELEQESDAMHQYIEGRKWREVAMQIGRSAASEEFS
ncbi:MAG TPA: CBS domain-containing protein [Thiotrichaceae bacterium]|jgi:CBS domain-containing protein|nr:CBS domain-containing protein [Thiotrichaceae bacterium]HIM07078.1 CBS domain-containing protein [Gammaproteobacteria bacterium]